jgi:hypothetical protein
VRQADTATAVMVAVLFIEFVIMAIAKHIMLKYAPNGYDWDS